MPANRRAFLGGAAATAASALAAEPGLAFGNRTHIFAHHRPSDHSRAIEAEDALDERQARRGAWLEIWSGDPAVLSKRILDAGLTQVHYGPTNTFYFVAPGGQVLGVVSGANPSAGELRTKP